MKINSDGSVSKRFKDEVIHVPRWMVEDCAISAELAEEHADYFVNGGAGELACLCREINKYGQKLLCTCTHDDDGNITSICPICSQINCN